MSVDYEVKHIIKNGVVTDFEVHPRPIKPTMPASRVLKEYPTKLCPQCKSSLVRKYIFFGKRQCLRQECPYNG